MTDTERNRVQAICECAGVSEIDDLSDGYHTFRQLYYQRMMLFATIVKQNKGRAWKSLRHEDGELCFGGGWFIVGIDTPEGSYTYHYEDNYFSLFDCKELERGKHWDGHTEKDVTRLLSLPSAQPEEHTKKHTETHACDLISRAAVKEWLARWDGYIDADTIARMQYRVIDIPSAQPEPRWIPVTERPRECTRVIGYMAWKAMTAVEYQHGRWYSIDHLEPLPDDAVIAWMPLPEPYRADEEEDEDDEARKTD